MIQNICYLTVVHQYLEMLPGEAFSIERLSVLDLQILICTATNDVGTGQSISRSLDVVGGKIHYIILRCCRLYFTV
jgi:hypothetical protein